MTGKHRLAVVLPLLLIAIFIGWNGYHQNHGGKVWQVRVSGYDPRDLLYGHYLNYRYDWKMSGPAASLTAPTCLCLNSANNSNRDPAARPVSCTAAPRNCDSVARVYAHGGGYGLNPDTNGEQYWIPEEKSAQIEALLRDPTHIMRVELRVYDNHTIAIGRLMIDNVLLESYLRDNHK